MTALHNQPSVSSASAGQSVPVGGNKPPLQHALEALTLNLEDELMRYRQNQYGDGVAPLTSAQLKFRQKRKRKPLELISVGGQTTAKSVSSVSKTVDPQKADVAPKNQPQKPPILAQHSARDQSSSKVQAASGGAGVLPPPLPPNPRLQELLGDQTIPTTQAYAPSVTGKGLIRRNGSLVRHHQTIPDDYWESTEVLLDSLPYDDDPEESYAVDDTEYSPSIWQQFSNPMGLGLLLLLLVGSASFGYLVTSPDRLGRLWNNPLVQALRSKPADSQGPVEGGAEDLQVVEDIETGLRGIGPDLSESEFKELDLGRISTLPSESSRERSSLFPDAEGSELTAEDRARGLSGEGATAANEMDAEGGRLEVTAVPGVSLRQPTTASLPAPRSQPQATPSRPSTAAPTTRSTPAASSQPARVTPSATAAPPQPLATNRPPQALPSVPVAPPGPISQPRAATTPPAPITQPPAAQPNYYVVTDYTGDQSLESARQAVGDAYVRNFPDGARIQMGSFAQESSAQNLVQELQGQGIPARVYSSP